MEEIDVQRILTLTAQTTRGWITALILDELNVAYIYGRGTVAAVITPRGDESVYAVVEHFATYGTVKTHESVADNHKAFSLNSTTSKVSSLIRRKTPPSGGVELDIWQAFRTKMIATT